MSQPQTRILLAQQLRRFLSSMYTRGICLGDVRYFRFFGANGRLNDGHDTAVLAVGTFVGTTTRQITHDIMAPSI